MTTGAAGSGGGASGAGTTGAAGVVGAGGASGAAGTIGNTGIAGAAGSGAGGGGAGAGGSAGAAEGGRGGSAGRGGAGGMAGGAATAGSGGRGGGSAGSAGTGNAGSTGGAGAATAGTGGAGTAGAGANPPGLYVSPAGSDANAGTMSAPFLTVTKARDVVRTMNSSMTQDLHVYLRGGTYNVATTVSFGIQDSGTNGHRIFYQAYPGETPVLNGATKVTGWTVSSGNVYKASLSRTTKLRNLYVNDVRAVMTSKTVTSRGGTGTYAVTSGQASWAWASGSGSDGAKYNTTDVPAIASNKDDLEIVNGTTWNENVVCVRDVVATSDGYRGALVPAAVRSHRAAAELERRIQRDRTHKLLQRDRIHERRRGNSSSTRRPGRSTTTRAPARTWRPPTCRRRWWRGCSTSRERRPPTGSRT